MNKQTAGRINFFTEIYNSFYSAIFSSICSKVNDFHESEDICQEVFMRLYQKIETVENPRAWLYGTMRIVLMDYYKGKGRKTEDIETIINDASMSYVNGFRESRIIIEEAMNNKNIFDDDRERSLFDLIAMYNYTYADAAEHTGLSYRQVRYSFEKTSKRIVDHLKQKGIKGLEELL